MTPEQFFARQKRDNYRRLKAAIRARLLHRTRPDLSKPLPMGFQKHYLNDLLCACAPDNGFTQDAIEYAILSDHVRLSGTYNLETDARMIMSVYDMIIETYRAARAAASDTSTPVH